MLLPCNLVVLRILNTGKEENLSRILRYSDLVIMDQAAMMFVCGQGLRVGPCHYVPPMSEHGLQLYVLSMQRCNIKCKTNLS